MLEIKTVQTQFTINRSIQTVWSILTDFDKYPIWNPFLIKIEKVSPYQLKVTTCMKGKKTSFSPKIISLDPPHELRWLGRLLGMSWFFQGEHYFLLKALSKEKTQIIHGEKFSGLLVNISWRLLQPRILESFSCMNQALKETCEKQNLLR